ncbi:gluconate kinase (FGGY family) [Halanaerobium saccharolyticum]|uniref:Gluconate kinase (FGGY family) n=1 Tax=Halanaerobium saccharolyticum TaxID=43595 RepID=A0A4V6Q835_9FIRM|nr:FGGY family carbohydrate kinase [Halanaerobium saccharolyticum]RAK06962.1 gluconate kinase (FGGY family) [Halanaerobium saccharolyticum]TDW01689.1 gluconate kinase (FGGY family) [Halanaerobium saccharolyticum]TDX53087.1 gluconate kinase (FGGY family) [Halanaerobium saccharolyticum]
MKLFAGLDIGTDGARIDVLTENLELKYEKSINYELISPQQGWAEQDPDQIFDTVYSLLAEGIEKFGQEDLYIIFSSVMHSIMAVDKQGKRLNNLIIWADSRGERYRDQLSEDYDSDLFYSRTGCPLHSSYWPAKIMWLKENVSEKIDKYVSIKEYIIFRLTNEWKTDYALASTSGIFNSLKKEYDKKILKILALSENDLADVYSGHHIFKFKIKNREVNGILGSTDGALANLGAGSINKSKIVLTAGSSSAVRYTSSEYTHDPEGRAWNYFIDQDFYIIGEATNGAGVVFDWFKNILSYDDIKKFSSENLPQIPYQGNEIIYIPTMMGERAPSYNEKTRGFFYGLSLNHSREDLVLAVYESIAFHLKLIYEDLLRLNNCEQIDLIMTGGLGLTDHFMKLLSYLLGEIKYIPDYKQNTAVGAAMLGIKVVDGISYSEMLKHFPDYKLVINKNDSDFTSYLDSKYQHFCEVYQHLQKNYEVFTLNKT